MEIPRSVIDGYDETVRSAVEAIQAELKNSLSLIDYSAPVEQIRAEVVSLMNAYCQAASDVGARVSSEFYNGLRLMVTGKDTTLSLQSGRTPEATERAVRAFVQKLVDEGEGGVADFEDLLMERVEYEAKRAVAYNTIDNARRDPDRPRFARVPQGERTCDFCLMLASRGPVYLTAESAGAYTKFHAHCDCKVIPFWDSEEDGASRRKGVGMSIEGYDPDELYRQYQERMEDPDFADRMRAAAQTAKQRHGSTSGGHATKESNERVSYRIAEIEKVTSMAELRRIVETTDLDGLTERQIEGLQNAVKRALMRLK